MYTMQAGLANHLPDNLAGELHSLLTVDALACLVCLVCHSAEYASVMLICSGRCGVRAVTMLIPACPPVILCLGTKPGFALLA